MYNALYEFKDDGWGITPEGDNIDSAQVSNINT